MVADSSMLSGIAHSDHDVSADAKVLVVDDREENLEVLSALIASPGITLLKATSGVAALELLLQHDVALALIDVRMPEMDGFQLAELMRGSERTRRVPIIFVTAGTPESGRIFKGYEAGAVDFLFKPLDPQLLQSKVAVFIELFRQRQQLAAQVFEHKQLVHTAELLIGVLSHDLRGPLSAIVTAGELLSRAYPNDERVGQIASRIRSSSNRMTRLIEQLLDFATARLGRLPLKPQPSNLTDLCEMAVAEFHAQRPDVFWEVEGDPVGTWDPDRLLQVLANLIGNAVQHGAAAHPIGVRVEGLLDAKVRIAVSNRGSIPEEIRDTIFSPFVRSTDSSRGAGLGLYIVEQIAKAHGGRVAVRCEDDMTTFEVVLPRHFAADSSAATN
jgi:two-component system, sensor histidine kinase and response regulator